MYCWNCGSPNEKSNQYCTSCNQYLRDPSLLRAQDSPSAVLNWTIFFNAYAIFTVIVTAILVNQVFIGGDKKMLFWALIVFCETIFAITLSIFLTYRLKSRIAVKKIDPQPVTIKDIGVSRVAGLINSNISHSYTGPSITETDHDNQPVPVPVKERN